MNTSTNSIYVTNHFLEVVSVIDGITNTVIATIPVGDNPVGLEVNSASNKVYVANSISSNVYIINSLTNTVDNIVPVTGVISLGVNPLTNRIYAAGTNNIAVIDGVTDTVLTVIPLTLFSPGNEGVGVNPSTNSIYASNQFADAVLIFSGSTNTQISSIMVGDSPQGIGVLP
ncbi:hypothetical protein D3C81_1618320 [compost metagenome]